MSNEAMGLWYASMGAVLALLWSWVAGWDGMFFVAGIFLSGAIIRSSFDLGATYTTSTSGATKKDNRV